MIYIIIAAVVVVLAVIELYIANNVFSISRYTVNTDKLSERTKLMFISDIHSKKTEKDIRKIINEYKPDMLVVGGDLWDRGSISNAVKIERDVKLLTDLSAELPVFYTPGNHDYSFPNRAELWNELKKGGVNVLRAESQVIRGIKLIGFDRLAFSNFESSLIGADDDMFRLLVTHFPQYFEEYASFKPELVLAGHAHGGQFRIPFCHKGLYSPGQGIFPKYSEGMHKKGNTSLIVSRGIGNSSSFPFRLFNRPEAVIIEINPVRDTL